MKDARCIEYLKSVTIKVSLYEAFEVSIVESLLYPLEVFTLYDDETQIRELFTLMSRGVVYFPSC